MNAEHFDVLWKKRKFKDAIAIYRRAGCPYWLSSQIARHWEQQGEIQQAMKELEHLLAEYRRLKIAMPLPGQTLTILFKLAKWNADAGDPQKARRYLRMLLKSRRDPYGVGSRSLRYTRQAERLLQSISGN